MATSANSPIISPDDEQAFRVQRWVFAFAFGIVVLGSYLAIAQWNLARFAAGKPSIQLDTWVDHHIPFVPQAFWLYICYYLIAISPAWLARKWSDFAPMATAYGVATALAWIVWIAVPVRIVTPPLRCTGFTCRLVLRFIEADGGVNVFPSMHVAHSVLAALFHRRARSGARWLVAAGALGVTVSTVLIRQHYFLDVPAGILTAVLGWVVAMRVAERQRAPSGPRDGSRCAS